MTNVEAPARPVEPFRLKSDGSAVPPPRDGLEKLERLLAQPVWTRADRDRMERASEGLGMHPWRECDGPSVCLKCRMADRIALAVKEWDRIAMAPPLPSTAQLRRPSRLERAYTLSLKLKKKRESREVEVHASVRQFKTYRVQQKWNEAAEAKDARLQRIERALARLERIAPELKAWKPWF